MAIAKTLFVHCQKFTSPGSFTCLLTPTPHDIPHRFTGINYMGISNRYRKRYLNITGNKDYTCYT